jgi:hypothetical protein
MAEAEAIIPENSQSILENEATNDENSKKAAENSEIIHNNSSETPPSEAPKKGRPVGSRDRAPRRKVKVEPIPAPVEEAPLPVEKPKAAPTPTPRVRTPSPEPPSPRTLYRQTSEHLLRLRDHMNDKKRSSMAERYTSKLHAWMPV